jgi:molybdenum cofactor biosynthesis protein B
VITSGRNSHRKAGPVSVLAAIVTISDTRTPETDTSGDFLEQALLEAGHQVVGRNLVKDEVGQIRSVLEQLLKTETQIIITSGGTGIAGRDVTIPVIESLIKKPIPGFGELFRMLSYEEVGAAAMLSRALGGLADGALIFALPGSLNAVKTAWKKLLKDELSHLVFEMLRHSSQEID